MLKIKEEEEKERKIFRVTLIKLKRKRDRRERVECKRGSREREESERPDVQGECCQKRKKTQSQRRINVKTFRKRHFETFTFSGSSPGPNLRC